MCRYQRNSFFTTLFRREPTLSKLPIHSIGYVLGRSPVLILAEPFNNHQKCVYLRDVQIGRCKDDSHQETQRGHIRSRMMITVHPQKGFEITVGELNFAIDYCHQHHIPIPPAFAELAKMFLGLD